MLVIIILFYEMSPLVVVIFCLHITYSVCWLEKDGVIINRHLLQQFSDIALKKNVEENVGKKDPSITINISTKNNNKTDVIKNEKVKSSTEAPLIKNDTKIEHKTFKATEMESGALLRGVSVVVVLTALVLVYMAVKTYCGKRGRNPVMVSKYGIRTRRSDIEMTPLPLDEDEEDETLFEVNNSNR